MVFAGAKLIKLTVFMASFGVTGWIGYTMWRNIGTYAHISQKVGKLPPKYLHLLLWRIMTLGSFSNMHCLPICPDPSRRHVAR